MYENNRGPTGKNLQQPQKHQAKFTGNECNRSMLIYKLIVIVLLLVILQNRKSIYQPFCGLFCLLLSIYSYVDLLFFSVRSSIFV